MSKLRVLVTGAAGMVGSVLSSDFACYNPLLTDHKLPKMCHKKLWHKLDLRKKCQMEKVINFFMPNIIIHLAALTDLEYCQKFPKESFHINALGTKLLAEMAKKINAELVYISTANVFPGIKKFYTENDRPKSLNIYGRSKLEGERYIRKILKKYYILRCGWMVGKIPEEDKKFVGLIIKQLKEGKKEIFAVNDKFGTLTFAENLSFNLKKLIDNKLYGIYHLACEQSVSRYDVAYEVLKYLKTKVKLIPVSSNFFKIKYFVPRPEYECIKSIKRNFIKIRVVPAWKTTLHKYLNNVSL